MRAFILDRYGSADRVRAAVKNSGIVFPAKKITVNLAPADVRKEGASFDLPSALGILGANGDLTNGKAIENTLSVGELSLDGRVRPIRGALSIALAARDNGITNILVPEENAREAAVVQGVNVFPVNNLRQAANVREVSARYPGGRILVIVGAAHKPWFDAFLSMMTDIEIVDATRVLR